MPTCIVFVKNDIVELNIYDAYGKLINHTELKGTKYLEIMKVVSGVTIVKSHVSGTMMFVCEVFEGSINVVGGNAIIK